MALADCAEASTKAAFCCVTRSRSMTASLTWAMPCDCSRVAMPICPISALTWATDCTTSSIVWRADCICTAPRSVWALDSPIRVRISPAALALRWASARTSAATTAKPRPCSPARAASTAALSARMLVWKAMPSMVAMIWPILREDCSIACTTSLTWATAAPPRRANSALCALSLSTWSVVSTDWRTVLESSSMDAAVCCKLLACDSVRADRSWEPWAISAEMRPKAPISLRASPTTARRLTWICCKRSISKAMGWRSRIRCSSPEMLHPAMAMATWLASASARVMRR